VGLVDGELGEEGGPGDDGELGALVEELPFGLLVESVVVELEVSSEPCEKVPRLVAWSRVSSRAWLLNTRRAVRAATPLAVPLPRPLADRPALRGGASESDVDLEFRAVSHAEPAPLPPAEAVKGDESGIGNAAPSPVPVDEDPAIADSGAEGFASEVPSLLLVLALEVVVCADLSELAVAPRAALRRPSAAAASPSDWPKERAGARTHSKVMVYGQVV
jgi:hypothetical protein